MTWIIPIVLALAAWFAWSLARAAGRADAVMSSRFEPFEYHGG